jgi:hypothetical protein
MRKICAWCNKSLDGISDESDTVISHGICKECSEIFTQYRQENFRDFVNKLPGIVFITDGNVMVMSANKAAGENLGKADANIEGLLGGNVLNCIYADMPGGCGKTEHCAVCAIRNNVTKTYRTGRAKHSVPAFNIVKTPEGNQKMQLLISTEKLGDFVLLRIDKAEKAV